MQSPHQHFNGIDVNRTLGAVLIGVVVASMLYGVTSFQTFLFFRSHRKDGQAFQLLIAFLWVLDTLHILFTIHGTYWYLVSHFSRFDALARPPWSFLAQVVVSCFSNFIVRCIFARRVWLLSQHNRVLLTAILSAGLFVFATGMAFVIRGFIDMTYSRFMKESWLLYTALGGDVVADILVTCSLCVLLRRSRTGLKSPDSLVNVLIGYTINTGLLTSICATASFVTYTIWPHGFIFMGIYFILSKLYLNSLLAALNTRETLRQRKTAIESVPQSPSDVEVRNLTAIILETPERTVEIDPS